jgi:hypothetical protein
MIINPNLMPVKTRYTDPRSQEAVVLSNALTSFVACDQGSGGAVLSTSMDKPDPRTNTDPRSGPPDLQGRGQCYFNLIPDL